MHQCLSTNAKTFQVVSKWPGRSSEGNQTSGQVPTVIDYYDIKDPNKFRWGWEVNQQTTKPLRWFKLLLNRTNPNTPGAATESLHRGNDEDLDEFLEDANNLIPLGMTIVDVVADYLKMLVKYTRRSIERTFQPAFLHQGGDGIPTDFVLTVPALWSDKAKSMMMEAAEKAGMTTSKNTVRLISEPEAAALHSLNFYQNTANYLKVRIDP